MILAMPEVIYHYRSLQTDHLLLVYHSRKEGITNVNLLTDRVGQVNSKVIEVTTKNYLPLPMHYVRCQILHTQRPLLKIKWSHYGKFLKTQSQNYYAKHLKLHSPDLLAGWHKKLLRKLLILVIPEFKDGMSSQVLHLWPSSRWLWGSLARQ